MRPIARFAWGVLAAGLLAWPAMAAPSSPVADSLPSPTALRVLARIPEPVPADHDGASDLAVDGLDRGDHLLIGVDRSRTDADGHESVSELRSIEE